MGVMDKFLTYMKFNDEDNEYELECKKEQFNDFSKAYYYEVYNKILK